MKSPFDIAKRYLEEDVYRQEKKPLSGDISDGPIIAVEICSNVLEAHIWLAFDEDFNPGDGQAVFYADELPFLKTKDAETLKEIHKYKLKLASGGGRVRQ